VKRRAVAAAGVVALCVAVAVPASAYTTRRVHTVVLPHFARGYNDASPTGTCPRTEHVQFGGFVTRGSAAVRGLRRTADNRWTVDGIMLSSNKVLQFDGSVTAIAYCGSGPVPRKVTHSERMGESGAVTATCPAGTVVVGGGFATSPHSFVAIKDLERFGADRWRVFAERFYGRRRTILTAIAYCGAGPAPSLADSRAALRGNRPTTVATCPAGRSLVFGGVRITTAHPKPGSTDLAAATVLKAPTATSWRVAGLSGGGVGRLTALAYCR
jgi:hypothetical protein